MSSNDALYTQLFEKLREFHPDSDEESAMLAWQCRSLSQGLVWRK